MKWPKTQELKFEVGGFGRLNPSPNQNLVAMPLMQRLGVSETALSQLQTSVASDSQLWDAGVT